MYEIGFYIDWYTVNIQVYFYVVYVHICTYSTWRVREALCFRGYFLQDTVLHFHS